MNKEKAYKIVNYLDYEPSFLGWAKSYDDEVSEFRELIEGRPDDEKQLRAEYKKLTGKRYCSLR